MYIDRVSIQEQVLDSAVRMCRARGGWTFRPAEVVAALPWLNAASVRTHVMSRCCANAPANHAHRWDYFRRVGRGRYEVLRAWRRHRAEVREAKAAYDAGSAAAVDPVLALYASNVDRTLLRENLMRTVDERLRSLVGRMAAIQELREAGRRGTRRRRR